MINLVESTRKGITVFCDSKLKVDKKQLPENLIKKMTPGQIADLACMRLKKIEADESELKKLILNLIEKIENLQFDGVQAIAWKLDLACLQLCVLEAFWDSAKDAAAKAKSNGSSANMEADSQLVTYFQQLYISQKKLRGRQVCND